MKLLVVNCGSSTLKFEVIEIEGEAEASARRHLARDIVDRVGGQGALRVTNESGRSLDKEVDVADHGGRAHELPVLRVPGAGVPCSEQVGDAIGASIRENLLPQRWPN